MTSPRLIGLAQRRERGQRKNDDFDLLFPVQRVDQAYHGIFLVTTINNHRAAVRLEKNFIIGDRKSRKNTKSHNMPFFALCGMIQKINRINAARLFDVAKTQQCREK